MLIDKRLSIEEQKKVVEHKKITVLYNQITASLDELCASIQSVFEHVDPESEAALEVTEKLAAMTSTVARIREAALGTKLESDFLNTTLIEVQKDLPQIKQEVRDLQVRIGRQSKRHAEHEKNAALSRRYAGVKW